MPMRVRVRETEQALGVRATTVEVGGRRFDAPIRSLALTATGACEGLQDLDPSCKGFVELFRELTRQALLHIDRNEARQRAFADQLFHRVNLIPNGDQAILLALALKDKGYCPRKNEASYLADLAGAPFVQLTMVPRVIPENVDDFLRYLDDFLDAFSTTRGPHLLGYIPNFAHRDLTKVVQRYLREGLSGVIMDYDGHHAANIYPNFLLVSRTLSSEIGEESYIHGLNVGPGVFRRSEVACPARDFLGLLSGLDSFGPKRIPRRMPPEVAAKLIQKGGAGSRVFSRQDYGYYLPAILRKQLASSQDSGVVRLPTAERNQSSFMLRMYNAERQGMEATVIRRHLRDGTLVRYVSRKVHLNDDLQRVRQFQSQRILRI